MVHGCSEMSASLDLVSCWKSRFRDLGEKGQDNKERLKTLIINYFGKL